jgi:hypothetical protein
MYLTQFIFVDDVLLFCDGSWRDANKLKEIVYYTTTSIMEINLQKYFVF